MPQSIARLHVHLIFSTKNREALIHDRIRQTLHGYMSGILKNIESDALLINSMEDHVHVLLELARTMSVSQMVERVKKSSSKWIKDQGSEFAGFAWQAGYGAFAVSESNVQSVFNYVANQRKHHEKKSFQEEYRAFLKRHRVAYDERYVWD